MNNLLNETFQKHLNLLKKHLNEKSKLLLEINFTVPEAIEVLKSYGVSNAGNLSSDELKKVYRKLASKYHPDSGGSHKDFININSAYETLKKSPPSSSQVPPQSNQQSANQQRQQSTNQQSTYDAWEKERQEFRAQWEKEQEERNRIIQQQELEREKRAQEYEKQKEELRAQWEKQQQELIAQWEKQKEEQNRIIQQQELERQKRMRNYQKV